MSEIRKDFVPYEQTHRLRPLLFVTTIVPDGQGDSVVALCHENEAAFCCVCHGKGTAPQEVLHMLPTSKKDIVFSILRSEKWPSFKAQIGQRFSVSKMAKGISYAVPLSSVAGVSIYKMLSNTRLFEKPVHQNEKKGR